MTQKEWKKMNGVQQWEWVIANPDFGIISLDNDCTFLYNDDLDESYEFYEDVGNRCEVLLDLLGLEAELC